MDKTDSLQVLISTLNGNPRELVKRMRIDSDAIIINQCDKNSNEKFRYKNHDILVFNTTDRGIGKSRELALNNSTADIILFADDDEVFKINYSKKILEAFRNDVKTDFIIFNIDDSESDRKHGDKISKIKKIHYWNCFKYGAARFAMRRNSIIQNEISFDENFGAARYLRGEDSVFIKDCLTQGLKITAHPILIAKLTNDRKSLWFCGYDKRFFVDTGAIFARSFGLLGILMLPPYIMFKHHLKRHALKNLYYSFLGYFSFIKHRLQQNTTIRHRIFEIAIVFCTIFSFKIYSQINSMMAIAVIMLIYFLLDKKYRLTCVSLIKKKYILILFATLITLILWSYIVILCNSSTDLSYIKLILHLILNLTTVLAVFAFFKKNNRTDQVINSIIIAFIIQVFCEWVFVIAPPFSDLFNFMRSDVMISKSEHYHNFRGIAISTFGFFSLSVSHCIVNILYWTKYNTLSKSPIIKTIVFIFLLSGAFFAGRTTLISLLFIPVIIWQKQKIRSRHRTRIARGITTAIASLSVIMVVSLSIPRMHSAINFITEPFRNITSSHSLQTTSTNSLIGMYQDALNNISNHNLIIGDGQYTTKTPDGNKYYGGVDIGFIRKIYFFGIIGLLLSFVMQIALFGKTIKEKITIVILVMLCILELKGEVIGASIIANTILLFYVLSDIESPVKIRGNPLVSVIIPTYGRSDKISRALKSITTQTYTNLEIIVVDDNSDNEETRKSTKSEVNNFKNIIFIENPKNLGGGGSRNRGIQKANGKYIAFLDDDDEYEPTKIEKQLSKIQEMESYYENAGLIYCWRSSIGVNNNRKKIIKHSWEGVPLDMHMCFMTAPTSCWLCSKKAIDFIGGFDKVPSQQDAIFILRLLTNNFRLYCVREPLVKYFEHSDDDGITKRASHEYFERVVAYQNLCRTYFSQLTKRKQKKVEFFFKSRLLNLYLDQNNKYEAKKLFIKMLMERPTSLQNTKNLIKIIMK